MISLPLAALALPAALLFPFFASAVSPATAPPPTPGAPTEPDDTQPDGTPIYRSASHVAAIDALRSGGFLDARTSSSSASTIVKDAGRSRPRNTFWPTFPAVSAGETKQALDKIIAALERGVINGIEQQRGYFSLVRDTTAMMNSKLALAWLRHNEAPTIPPFAWPMSDLGKAAQRAYQARGQLALTPATTSANQLGIWWWQVMYLAEWMDTVGAPLGGAEGLEGGIVDSIRVGWQAAQGTIADVLLTVGGFAAGIVGEAAWSVIASPIGAVLLGVLLWMVTQ